MSLSLTADNIDLCRYWPRQGGTVHRHGDVWVNCKMVIQHKGYIETVLHLQHEFSDNTLDVIHFWFTGWHVERVPVTDDQRANTAAFVRFVTAVRKASGDGTQETTVVHCDTGVGRTGAYVKLPPLKGSLSSTLFFFYYN